MSKSHFISTCLFVPITLSFFFLFGCGGGGGGSTTTPPPAQQTSGVIALNSTLTDNLPNTSSVKYYKISGIAAEKKYSVHLKGPDNTNFDLYLNTGSIPTTSSYKSTSTSFAKAIYFIPHSTDVYLMIRSSYGTGYFEISVKSMLNDGLTIMTSNVGNTSCSGIMYKLCTKGQANTYKAWINTNLPDIINLQEVATYRVCKEAGPGTGNKNLYSCPLNNSSPYSICCYLSTSIPSAVSYLVDTTQYDTVCDNAISQHPGFECTAIRKGKLSYAQSISSYRSQSTSGGGYSGLCKDGFSVNTLVLKDITTQREFILGNAHPEIGSISDADVCTSTVARTAAKWSFESLCDTYCRADEVSWLFNTVAKRGGVPENAIVTGDFNMQYNPNNVLNVNNPDDKELVYAVDYGDYQEIKNAPITGGFLLDHIFSNFLKGSYCFTQLFAGFDHQSIYCQMSNMVTL